MPGNHVFKLERKLDTTAARALASALLSHRGQPLEIDGSAVETIGGLAVEVLIAAGLQWQADGQPVSLVSPSSRMEDVCRTLGLRPDAPWLTEAADPGRSHS